MTKGKKRGRTAGSGQFKTMLPQTSATEEMAQQARILADRDYFGSVGALIRAALQEKFDREKDAEERTNGYHE